MYYLWPNVPHGSERMGECAGTVEHNSNLDNPNSPLTRTRFPFPFTEIYPDNSNSPLTRTVFRFPSEFELSRFYCIYKKTALTQYFFVPFLCKEKNESQDSRLHRFNDSPDVCCLFSQAKFQ